MFESLSTIFNILIYKPILNALVFLYNVLGNFGLSIIILTIIIKLILDPLNKKSIESQKAMTEIQPKIKEIQKKYKDNKEEQGRELLKLYKDANFNPFAGILVLFLQLPIIWALFMVFKTNLDLNAIAPSIYSFISIPQSINYYFLGVNLAEPNIFIAIITAVAQFIQTKTMVPSTPNNKEEKTDMEQAAEMMQKQMVFLAPIITFFVLFKLPAALGLYWCLSTILNVIQQKRIYKK
ncbi:MAG TPA: YidC/Oxa1 family membrane protein insertase [Candidatus Pacearchaeota archaeon]|nr:membrane protein insertase YidC [Candidatus Parcubacteria bacterium]HOC53691.1 YidC/Oxa1 family membrane protein insertase [Candidatus Pacearchaeota archaeon]HQM24511.1 YidC/Oxa1 family membrane protein insertase [Candidatus Pacearchaeota archaeon]